MIILYIPQLYYITDFVKIKYTVEIYKKIYGILIAVSVID